VELASCKILPLPWWARDMSLTNTGLSGLNFLIVVKMSGRCVSRCVERESYLQFSMTEMQCYSGPMYCTDSSAWKGLTDPHSTYRGTKQVFGKGIYLNKLTALFQFFTAVSLRARRPGFDSRQGQSWDFFSPTPSRPTLRPTQLPIQWVSGALTPEIKQPGRGTDYSRP
jgi:hypothetical protein